MTTKGNDSKHTLRSRLDALEYDLNRVDEKAYTHNGVRGYFVEEDRLAYLMDSAQELLNDDETGILASRGMEILNDLDRMREDVRKSKEQEVKARQAVVDIGAERAQALKTVQKLTERHASDQQKWKDEKAKLKAQMADLVAARELLLKESKAPAAKFDPDTAAVLDARIKEVTEEKKRVELLQAELNQEKQAANDELNAAHRKLKETTAELKEVQADLAKYVDARARVASPVKEPPQLVVLNAKRLLGEQGFQKFLVAQQQLADDTREKAFSLWQALAAAPGQLAKAISRLLKNVWLWCKTKNHKVRKVVEPWLLAIEKDVAAGLLKPVAYYRDLLREVHSNLEFARNGKIRDAREKAAATGSPLPPHAPDNSEPETWLDWARSWTKVLGRRAKSALGFKVYDNQPKSSGIVAAVQKAWAWLTSPYYKVKSALKDRRPPEYKGGHATTVSEELFDYEEEAPLPIRLLDTSSDSEESDSN